tara:strand:+ start:174 stop:389 length:216 start_codon:yes stop_codon:yes gene_type:complete
LSFNTQNTKSFIHAEQYGKKKKRLKTQVAKLLSTTKASQINSFTSLNLKPQVSGFKTAKQAKLKTKKRRRG